MRIVAYTYDAAGRLSRETNGNGTYTTYGYDSAGQVTAINNYAPNGAVNSFFQYTYNTLGQQTTATTRDGKWTYTYDPTGQLTRAQLASTNASIANQDLQYVYDAAGNRISTVINGVTTNYAANNLNQYTTVGGAVQTYDADGNLIKVVNGTQTTTYTYNKRNQLVGVKCQLSCPVGDNYLSSRGIGSVPWLSDNYGERPRVDHQKRDAPRSGREHVFPARPVVWVRSLPG